MNDTKHDGMERVSVSALRPGDSVRMPGGFSVRTVRTTTERSSAITGRVLGYSVSWTGGEPDTAYSPDARVWRTGANETKLGAPGARVRVTDQRSAFYGQAGEISADGRGVRLGGYGTLGGFRADQLAALGYAIEDGGAIVSRFYTDERRASLQFDGRQNTGADSPAAELVELTRAEYDAKRGDR